MRSSASLSAVLIEVATARRAYSSSMRSPMLDQSASQASTFAAVMEREASS